MAREPATVPGDPRVMRLEVCFAAVFDAAGIRLRRAPFAPERVKSALGNRQT
jgi:hypothetical protein